MRINKSVLVAMGLAGSLSGCKKDAPAPGAAKIETRLTEIQAAQTKLEADMEKLVKTAPPGVDLSKVHKMYDEVLASSSASKEKLSKLYQDLEEQVAALWVVINDINARQDGHLGGNTLGGGNPSTNAEERLDSGNDDGEPRPMNRVQSRNPSPHGHTDGNPIDQEDEEEDSLVEEVEEEVPFVEEVDEHPVVEDDEEEKNDQASLGSHANQEEAEDEESLGSQSDNEEEEGSDSDDDDEDGPDVDEEQPVASGHRVEQENDNRVQFGPERPPVPSRGNRNFAGSFGNIPRRNIPGAERSPVNNPNRGISGGNRNFALPRGYDPRGVAQVGQVPRPRFVPKAVNVRSGLDVFGPELPPVDSLPNSGRRSRIGNRVGRIDPTRGQLQGVGPNRIQRTGQSNVGPLEGQGGVVAQRVQGRGGVVAQRAVAVGLSIANLGLVSNRQLFGLVSNSMVGTLNARGVLSLSVGGVDIKAFSSVVDALRSGRMDLFEEALRAATVEASAMLLQGGGDNMALVPRGSAVSMNDFVAGLTKNAVTTEKVEYVVRTILSVLVNELVHLMSTMMPGQEVSGLIQALHGGETGLIGEGGDLPAGLAVLITRGSNAQASEEEKSAAFVAQSIVAILNGNRDDNQRPMPLGIPQEILNVLGAFQRIAGDVFALGTKIVTEKNLFSFKQLDGGNQALLLKISKPDIDEFNQLANGVEQIMDVDGESEQTNPRAGSEDEIVLFHEGHYSDEDKDVEDIALPEHALNQAPRVMNQPIKVEAMKQPETAMRSMIEMLKIIQNFKIAHTSDNKRLESLYAQARGEINENPNVLSTFKPRLLQLLKEAYEAKKQAIEADVQQMRMGAYKRINPNLAQQITDGKALKPVVHRDVEIRNILSDLIDRIIQGDDDMAEGLNMEAEDNKVNEEQIFHVDDDDSEEIQEQAAPQDPINELIVRIGIARGAGVDQAYASAVVSVNKMESLTQEAKAEALERLLNARNARKAEIAEKILRNFQEEGKTYDQALEVLGNLNLPNYGEYQEQLSALLRKKTAETKSKERAEEVKKILAEFPNVFKADPKTAHPKALRNIKAITGISPVEVKDAIAELQKLAAEAKPKTISQSTKQQSQKRKQETKQGNSKSQDEEEEVVIPDSVTKILENFETASASDAEAVHRLHGQAQEDINAIQDIPEGAKTKAFLSLNRILHSKLERLETETSAKAAAKLEKKQWKTNEDAAIEEAMKIMRAATGDEQELRDAHERASKTLVFGKKNNNARKHLKQILDRKLAELTTKNNFKPVLSSIGKGAEQIRQRKALKSMAAEDMDAWYPVRGIIADIRAAKGAGVDRVYREAVVSKAINSMTDADKKKAMELLLNARNERKAQIAEKILSNFQGGQITFDEATQRLDRLNLSGSEYRDQLSALLREKTAETKSKERAEKVEEIVGEFRKEVDANRKPRVSETLKKIKAINGISAQEVKAAEAELKRLADGAKQKTVAQPISRKPQQRKQTGERKPEGDEEVTVNAQMSLEEVYAGKVEKLNAENMAAEAKREKEQMESVKNAQTEAALNIMREATGDEKALREAHERAVHALPWGSTSAVEAQLAKILEEKMDELATRNQVALIPNKMEVNALKKVNDLVDAFEEYANKQPFDDYMSFNQNRGVFGLELTLRGYEAQIRDPAIAHDDLDAIMKRFHEIASIGDWKRLMAGSFSEEKEGSLPARAQIEGILDALRGMSFENFDDFEFKTLRAFFEILRQVSEARISKQEVMEVYAEFKSAAGRFQFAQEDIMDEQFVTKLIARIVDGLTPLVDARMSLEDFEAEVKARSTLIQYVIVRADLMGVHLLQPQIDRLENKLQAAARRGIDRRQIWGLMQLIVDEFEATTSGDDLNLDKFNELVQEYREGLLEGKKEFYSKLPVRPAEENKVERVLTEFEDIVERVKHRFMETATKQRFAPVLSDVADRPEQIRESENMEAEDINVAKLPWKAVAGVSEVVGEYINYANSHNLDDIRSFTRNTELYELQMTLRLREARIANPDIKQERWDQMVQDRTDRFQDSFKYGKERPRPEVSENDESEDEPMTNLDINSVQGELYILRKLRDFMRDENLENSALEELKENVRANSVKVLTDAQTVELVRGLVDEFITKIADPSKYTLGQFRREVERYGLLTGFIEFRAEVTDVSDEARKQIAELGNQFRAAAEKNRAEILRWTQIANGFKKYVEKGIKEGKLEGFHKTWNEGLELLSVNKKGEKIQVKDWGMGAHRIFTVAYEEAKEFLNHRQTITGMKDFAAGDTKIVKSGTLLAEKWHKAADDFIQYVEEGIKKGDLSDFESRRQAAREILSANMEGVPMENVNWQKGSHEKFREAVQRGKEFLKHQQECAEKVEAGRKEVRDRFLRMKRNAIDSTNLEFVNSFLNRAENVAGQTMAKFVDSQGNKCTDEQNAFWETEISNAEAFQNRVSEFHSRALVIGTAPLESVNGDVLAAHSNHIELKKTKLMELVPTDDEVAENYQIFINKVIEKLSVETEVVKSALKGSVDANKGLVNHRQTGSQQSDQKKAKQAAEALKEAHTQVVQALTRYNVDNIVGDFEAKDALYKTLLNGRTQF